MNTSEQHQHDNVIDILIIGGGSAGITVAARLKREDPQLDIAIVEPSDKHYYQPLWTLVGGGVGNKEDTEREEIDLIPKGVKWIRDAASTISPDNNQLTTVAGRTLRYRYLIVAPGLQLDWHKVKGLSGNVGKFGICSNYSFETVDYTWECIKAFRGGNAIFTFPNTPVKCGGAPQKIMYLAEHYFRKNKVRKEATVIFASAGASIFAVKKYANALTKIIQRQGIQSKFRHNLVEVVPDKKEAIFENLDSGERTTMPFQMLHVTPPMSAPDFVKSSPLANAAGWVDVDKHRLQHLRFPNVFSLGDASSLPTSKTGAAVRMQAPVLVENLMARRAGREGAGFYDGYTSCPLVTGYGKLILAEFDYDGNPKETFPIDQSKERLSMYLLKKHVLPELYWKGMLKGRA